MNSVVYRHVVKCSLFVATAASYNLDILCAVQSVKLFAMAGLPPGACSKMQRA
jgi:hypothetical protein